MPESIAAPSIAEKIDALEAERDSAASVYSNDTAISGAVRDALYRRIGAIDVDLTDLYQRYYRESRAALRALPAAEYERKTTDEDRASLRGTFQQYKAHCESGVVALLDDLASCERALQATAAELAEANATLDRFTADLMIAQAAIHKLTSERDEARRERDALRQAVNDLLMSMDIHWYETNAGHDWREAVDSARALLSRVRAT